MGQIKKLVAQAKKTKPKTQVLANKAAKWLTFSALMVAVVSLVVWIALGQSVAFAITIAITVLVIACPHALGLAIPTVTTIATRLATTHGLFIKDLSKLEVIKDASYVVFDKTGTLTQGSFRLTHLEYMRNLETLTSLKGWSDMNKEELKSYLARLVIATELQSTHPLATQIVDSLKKKTNKQSLLKVKRFHNHPGKGVLAEVDGHTVLIGTKEFLLTRKAMLCTQLDSLAQSWQKEGETTIYVAVDNKQVMALALSDKVRKEAEEAVKNLHRLGLKVAMLTGDNQQTADKVAGQLNIDTVFAQVLPQDKYRYVKKLQDKQEVVIMVGDGINDAPALTQADVGVVISAGTDVAQEAGDVILTRNNPLDVVSLITLSRKTYQKMVQNLIWAIGYNVVAIPAAAGVFASFGFFLSPGVGALLMSLSSVIVVINAFGLKKTSLNRI